MPALLRKGRGIIVTTKGPGSLHLVSYASNAHLPAQSGITHTDNAGETCFLISHSYTFTKYAFHWGGAGEAFYSIGTDRVNLPVGRSWKEASALTWGDEKVSTLDVSNIVVQSVDISDEATCFIIPPSASSNGLSPQFIWSPPLCTGTRFDPKGNGQLGNVSNVAFKAPYPVPPHILLGFDRLEISNSTDIRVKATASDITPSDFKINFEDLDDGNHASVSWLGVTATNPSFHTGQVSTTECHWHAPDLPQSMYSKRVYFTRPYTNTPKVVCFLHQFDMCKQFDWRIETYVTDIDTKGFTIHIDSMRDTIISSAAATWFAYPDGHKNVVSGTIGTIGTPPGEPAIYSQDGNISKLPGVVRFPSGAFERAPYTFVAISAFNIDHKANLGLAAFTFGNKANLASLNWTISAESDAVLYGASATYICIA